MRRRIVVGAGIAVALVLSATAASAAPVSSSPPTVKGDLSFLRTVSCEPGSWSGSPTSFAYAWLVGGSPTGPVTQTFAVDKPYYMGGYTIACQVTATDASGASTTAVSAAAKPALGRTKLKLTKIVTKAHGVIIVTGKLTPALVGKGYGGGEVLLHRSAPAYGPKAVFQLGDAVSISRKGTFKAIGHDKAGSRKIRVDFYPGHAAFGLWAPASVTRTIAVKR